MTTLYRLLMLLLFMMGVVVPAWAEDDDQIVCTWEWDKSNGSVQEGTGPWLKYTVSTFWKGDLPPCQIGFYAEGKVDGINGTALRASGTLAGTATKEVMVPSAGKWTTSGKHSRSTIFGEQDLGSSSSEAEVNYTPYEEPPQYDCATDPGLPQCSPLLVDVLGNGFQFTNAQRGVAFDIAGDGTLQQVSWTQAGSDDAWLVFDPNGNGHPGENGLEMFGNFTHVYPRGDASASNGFEALKFFEGLSYAPALADNVIDARDSIWAKLSLWTDRNHDGLATSDELQPVSDVLQSISLAYESGRRHKQGNYLLQVSSATLKDGTRVTVADVWLSAR